MPPKERPSPDYYQGYCYPCNVYGHVRQLEAPMRDETLVELICQSEKRSDGKGDAKRIAFKP